MELILKRTAGDVGKDSLCDGSELICYVKEVQMAGGIKHRSCLPEGVYTIAHPGYEETIQPQDPPKGSPALSLVLLQDDANTAEEPIYLELYTLPGRSRQLSRRTIKKVKDLIYLACILGQGLYLDIQVDDRSQRFDEDELRFLQGYRRQ